MALSRNERNTEFNKRMVDAIDRIESSLSTQDFIEPGSENSFLKEFKQIRNDVERKTPKLTYAIGLVNKETKANMQRFSEVFDGYPENVRQHNQTLAESLAIEVGKRINPVEGRDLDEQQLTAIALDLRSRLVIAGAGTGKTTTTIGLVKDILLTGKASPEEILVLSFTNASVNELKQRILKETGTRVETTTFHRLGLKVIAEADGKVPHVTKTDLRKFVTEELTRLRSDRGYLKKLNSYLAFDYDSIRDENQFTSSSELVQYLKENPLVTLNGEKVKSFGEADIANCLAMHGVEYIYEDAYEHDTADSQFGQYHPDFHISGTNVYIEYFGIDRTGGVARFMTDENPNAAEEYKAGMEWKRGIHNHYGTRLIELFAYDRSEGTLIDKLESEIDRLHLSGTPSTPEEIFDRSLKDDKWKFSSLASMMTTAILLIKGFGKPWDDVYPHPKDRGLKKQLSRLEEVIRPVYEAYQKVLSDNGEIDFEDMLNMAADRIRDGAYIHGYRYVIVDEYQDLSRSRFNLLKAMRRSKDYRLFCVGDDWQSIYRFNGCDVCYILDFERYWGPSAICKIESTYRFSGELLRMSSRFVSRNPRQYPKHLVGKAGKESRAVPIVEGAEYGLLKRIGEILDRIPMGKSVLFLGRYNHDVRLLSSAGFSWRPEISDNSDRISYTRRPDLEMRFMTIHSSKGLQADYVFSINNKTGRYGFPTKRDEPVLIPMLLGNNNKQMDEERRLFYVAMTRARDTAYILGIRGQLSDFFREMFPEMVGKMDAPPLVCPVCGGTLIVKKGKFGMFYGCTNYATRGCKFTRTIDA